MSCIHAAPTSSFSASTLMALSTITCTASLSIVVPLVALSSSTTTRRLDGGEVREEITSRG